MPKDDPKEATPDLETPAVAAPNADSGEISLEDADKVAGGPSMQSPS